MRKRVYLTVAVLLACAAPWVHGQDQKAEIQKRLASQFTLTKITADRTDIVTAGSIVELHKDGLGMFRIDTSVPPLYTYKDGKLSMGFGAAFATNMALGQAQPGANTNNVPQRKFVTGEKFWVTGFSVKEDGVILKVYSDPYDDVRYYGQLRFPFLKHSIPPADEVLQTIAEVLTVVPADNSAGDGQQQAPAQDSSGQDSSTPDSSAAAPIAPPPPPADAPPAPPKTIALGQTKDQVVAIFGQPQKIVNLGAKEMYYYPDMKVIFVDGKVSDVQ